jgi:hypothetical protein
MRRYLAPIVVLAALACAAPAQADVTASVITTPKGPHYAMSYGFDTTAAVAGRATGIGNVDIACVGPFSTYVLAPDVPVAGDGTFSASVILDPLDASPSAGGTTCRLRALPAGTLPPDLTAFRGPTLGLSKFAVLRNGPNNTGKIGDFLLWASGTDRATATQSFGACAVYGFVLDAASLQPGDIGFNCAGQPVEGGVKIDGVPAYAPSSVRGQIGNVDVSGLPGVPELDYPDVTFDANSGAAVVSERDPFVKCGPDTAYPPTQAGCTRFDAVPVQLRRTTSITGGDQVVRVVDRWSSTDGKAHRLDLTLDSRVCCNAHQTVRLPGQPGFMGHGAGDAVPGPFPAGAPIFIRDGDHSGGSGKVVLPLQSADGARFPTQADLALEYRARTIPARGELTFTHYYVVTRTPGEADAAAARLLASLAKPAPHGGGGAPHPVTPALPLFSRAGKLRVRRAGRTFRVTTRDRVTCPTACTVHVSGRRVVATDLHLAAGERAAVRFRLTRAGARKLRRAGRVRLRITLAAPGVSVRRTVRVIRTGRS